MMKIYHYAAKICEDGAVSALCFLRLRPIDLSRASWTIRPDAVTCVRCRRLLKDNPPVDATKDAL